MKKIAIVLLAAVLVLGAVGVQADALVMRIGMLGFSASTQEEFGGVLDAHLKAHYDGELDMTLTYYDNLTSMLMGLRARDINVMLTGRSVAEYMTARSDALVIVPDDQCPGIGLNNLLYTMMLREDSA